MQVSLCVLATSLLVLGLATAQQQLQCPAETVTEVDGELIFGPLSPGSGAVDATYDPGTIGAWNALANGFVDAVRSGSLPFGEGGGSLHTCIISKGSACRYNVHWWYRRSRRTVAIKYRYAFINNQVRLFRMQTKLAPPTQDELEKWAD